MAKRESREPQPDRGAPPPQARQGGKEPASGLPNKWFAVIKFVLGICALPVVYATTRAFLETLSVLDESVVNQFWAGVVTFLVTFLFFYEPEFLYQKGQRMVEIIFSFFNPLVKVAPHIIPVYAVLIVCLYSAVSLFIPQRYVSGYFMFALGFSAALHLVYSGRTLKGKKEDVLKANYLFGFSLVYIINIIFIAVCLNFSFDKFDLAAFFEQAMRITRYIFDLAAKQLFVPK